MSGSSRAITLSLSVRDADVVRTQLLQMGEAGEQALTRLDAAARRVTAGGGGGLPQISTGAQTATRDFGSMREAVGSAGFQLQDFAVQVQGGTSALTALSQQGSQFLGVFGPAGAVAGAALTVGILAAQILGLSEEATTLDEVLKDVDATYKRLNDAVEARIRGVTEEAEAVNRLAVGYTAMSAASQRAESLVLRRQTDALAQQERDLRSTSTRGLRGLTNPTLPDQNPAGDFTGFSTPLPLPSDAGLTVLRQALDAYDAQTRVTVEGQRRLATTLDGVARTAGDNAVALIRQRDAVLDSIPAVARLEEAQKQTAIQTVALMQAQGASREEIARYTSAFGGLANEIVRTATSMQTLARINSQNPFATIEESAARTDAQLAALRRGGLDALEAERQRQAVAAAGASANQSTFEAEVRNLRQLGLSQEAAEAQAAEAAQAAQRRAEEGVRASQALSAEERRAEEARRASARGGGGRASGSVDRSDPTGALERLRNQRATALEREIDQLTRSVETPIERYQRRLEELAEVALRARSEGNPIPDETISRSADAALADLERLERGAQQTSTMGRELGMTFSSAFEDAIIKGKSFREVLEGIIQDLARIVLRQTVTAPLGNAISQGVQGFDWSKLLPFANGGIMTGSGPVPLRRYAGGGIANSPQLAMFGEGSTPEAYVPLPDGRRIPVAMEGGGAVTFSPTINVDARGSDANTLARARMEAQAIAASTIAQFADSIQRGGSAAKIVGRR